MEGGREGGSVERVSVEGHNLITITSETYTPLDDTTPLIQG